MLPFSRYGKLYAAHFTRDYTDEKGPARQKISAALAHVGHDGIELNTGHVRFARPGMGITLNGIGQGYITDRVAEILLSVNGMDRALIDMGETRAIGNRPEGSPWLVGLEDPRAPGQVAETIPLRDRAVATSGGMVPNSTLQAASTTSLTRTPARRADGISASL